MIFARVALNVPLPTLFDYRAPNATGADIGARVVVPFGRKVAAGIIVELTHSSALSPQRVRTVLRLMRDVPPLPSDILELIKFCSSYYQHPIGATMLSVLPARFRQLRPIGHPQRYRLSENGRTIKSATLHKRSVGKLKLLRLLNDNADAGVDAATIRAAGIRADVLKTMLKLGWVEQTPTAMLATPPATASDSNFVPGPVLNGEQHAALKQVRTNDSNFVPWLLHGVTGSGKTEVYFHLIADALARGRQALVLVPEINLTPQLEADIAARFPQARLAKLHSALNESERLHAWLAAHSGQVDIVLGTRLAIFTPLPRLGLIVVDEEHDTSFKQAEGLCYSARDVALMRAKRLDIPIVLGSATPALETFQQALTGRYRLLTLSQRINTQPPRIECIDTQREPLIDGLSQKLLTAIQETLERREQSLIFINRRGYSPVLLCRSCNWTSDCHRCSAKLVLHLQERLLRCHYCGHTERVPTACPQCGNQDLLPVGQGTQRIESALARMLPPSTRILRIDRDSTRRKHAWRDMREQIRARQVDVLVGTQILAKGHDFPQLTLVGVLNADSSLYSTDFRASERLYARLAQVAGRAGRAALPGRVLVQTDFQSHPLYQALRRHDYTGFAQAQLDERKQAGLPPFVYQAVLRAEAPQLAVALDFLTQAANDGTKIKSAVTLFDPIPATVTRRAGMEHAYLVVEARSRQALQDFLRAWRERLEAMAKRKVRWTLDVDPLEL